MTNCPLLDRLPVELRLHVYELLLTFTAPIKLRCIVPGSRNLSLLRTCRQIHTEALSVLHDLNTIVITRNDFCPNTDSTLKTPVNWEYVRHLRVVAFSQSIACMSQMRREKCSVCRPDASGLIEVLIKMPRLKSCVVDYRDHLAEMRAWSLQVCLCFSKQWPL